MTYSYLSVVYQMRALVYITFNEKFWEDPSYAPFCVIERPRTIYLQVQMSTKLRQQ
jgi:hypothetical protein